MAKAIDSQPLLLSVLDRLVDEDPGNSRDAPKNGWQTLREIKQNICRDLENLLNTRWKCTEWPPDLEGLDVSLVNYGIPDFGGAHMGAASRREELREIIESTIRNFEPRFVRVSVELLDQAETEDRKLRFRIDALMRAEPAPEPVVFDSALEPTTGAFDVKGAN